jgi:peptidoglycan hydrolase-like protein with peptidoglycan-binding domain
MQLTEAMKLPFQTERSIADSHRRIPKPPPIALLQAAILAFALHGMAAAEGPIYAVQDALKREHLFVGERTGVLDPPTRSALRRFQARHALPETGEIDTDTLQILQSSTEAGRPVIQSHPTATADSSLNEAIVEKDREFLRNLEASGTGHEQNTTAPSELATTSEPIPKPTQASGAEQSPQPTANPAPAAVPAPEPPPSSLQPTVAESLASDETSQPSRQTEVRKPEVAKSRSVEKPRSLARRKVEGPARVGGSDYTPRQQGELEPGVITPPRHVESRILPANSRVVEIDNEPEPLDSGGVRILRSTTTSPDGRTYTKTTTYSGTVTPTIRRAEPVEPPPRKKSGFFDRLFKDD